MQASLELRLTDIVVGRDQACYNVNEIHQKTHQQGSSLSSQAGRQGGYLSAISGQNRFVQQHSTFIDDTPA